MTVRKILATLAVAFLCAALPLLAQQETFVLEPAQSHVAFTLGDVLHTVHGTFQMKSGVIRFDPATGAATGQLVVDATSGDSGSKMRDRKMNKDVLESEKYPEIVFAINHVTGTLPASGASTLQVSGSFTLHGEAHPLTLTIPVTVSGDQAAADINFDVPYVKWGLKDPSTLFLRVEKQVQIAVHAVGKLETTATTATTR